MFLFDKLENHFQIGLVALFLDHTNGPEKPQILRVKLTVFIGGDWNPFVGVVRFGVDGLDDFVDDFLHQDGLDLFGVVLVVLEELDVEGSLADFDQVPKLVDDVPVAMEQLLVFPALINKMVEQLETLLKGGQMFFTDLLFFLFFQQIKISLQQLQQNGMHPQIPDQQLPVHIYVRVVPPKSRLALKRVPVVKVRCYVV